MYGGGQLGNEFLEVFARELHPIVDDNRLWNAEISKDVSFVEIENVSRGDSSQRFCLYLLGEVVDNHYQIFVLVRSHHKWSKEVQAPPDKGPGLI